MLRCRISIPICVPTAICSQLTSVIGHSCIAVVASKELGTSLTLHGVALGATRKAAYASYGRDSKVDGRGLRRLQSKFCLNNRWYLISCCNVEMSKNSAYLESRSN